MWRSISLSSIAITSTLLLSSAPSWAAPLSFSWQIDQSAEPYTATGQLYTTNNETGQLARSEITGWSISLLGDEGQQFVLNPENSVLSYGEGLNIVDTERGEKVLALDPRIEFASITIADPENGNRFFFGDRFRNEFQGYTQIGIAGISSANVPQGTAYAVGEGGGPTPVPFDFSPTLGLGILGVLALGNKLTKRKALPIQSS